MKRPMEANTRINGSVRIDDPFWTPKLRTFFDITLPDSFDKLEQDGAIENYENLIAGNLHTHKACPWHDGLLLETIRGASDYLLRGEKSDELVQRIDRYAEIISRAQLATGGGYLSTYTQLDRPHQRYGINGGSILWQHDLYNNGCLLEAGVHYYRATGKMTLLECALRSANDLCMTIGEPPKMWIVPGHSLPEYALIELYELVRDEPGISAKTSVPVQPEEYLRLAHFWIHGRGHHEHRTNHPQYMGEYAQDHAPIENQFQAVGHAVRATLYYTGVTRLAMLEGDGKLLAASKRLWNNVSERKLHVNGGVGATHFEEKYGEDYNLPNDAYLETCATVGLIFWAESLSRATGDAKYFDIIERSLYNLMLSSVTLQGDGYFYRNPLASDGNDHHWAWHGCPCCPPMIHKTFGIFDQLICAQDEYGLFVNLFAGGTIEASFSWGSVRMKSHSALPRLFNHTIQIEKADSPFMLRLRIPSWAGEKAVIQLNGQTVQPEIVKGYACLPVRQGDNILFMAQILPRRIETHPYVSADRGCVAVAHGPLIYCAEGIDNKGKVDFTLAEDPAFSIEDRPDLLGGVSLIHASAADKKRFTLVPLYAWDNRMAGKMRVWLKQAGKPDTWDTDGWEGKLYRDYTP